MKWFQQYMKADMDLPRALLKLPVEGDLAQEVKDELEQFVCLKYCPKGVRITSIPDLRWHMFCKQLAESNMLPPTLGALEEHIKRVRLQSRVCTKPLSCINSLLSHYSLATIRTQTASCCQSQHWFFLHHKLLLRW